MSKIKIVATSDTHRKHKQVEVPEGDIFIHAGDMTSLGTMNEFISVGNWMRGLAERFKHVMYIPGNHDIGYQTKASMFHHVHFSPSVHLLLDNGIEAEGLKIYGTPWMPEFYDWAFMLPEDELPAKYALIPDDTEVLVTHCPPYSILDKNTWDERCGSISLLNRVKELKHLKCHIFGHIHGSEGSEVIDGVQFHNVAALDETYFYKNKAHVIEVEV